MRPAKKIGAACAVTAVLLCGVAWAHKGATGIVKERMDVMSSIGANMKTIGEMLEGKTAFDGKRVEAAARAIAGHADQFHHLFPEGTNDKPSEALPVIWKDWDRFIKLAADLKKTSIVLAETALSASDADDIRIAALLVAGTCKACHTDFRLKKK